MSSSRRYAVARIAPPVCVQTMTAALGTSAKNTEK